MANATLNIGKLKEKQTATFDIEGGKEYTIEYTMRDMTALLQLYNDIARTMDTSQNIGTDGAIDFAKFNASSDKMESVTAAAHELIGRLLGVKTFEKLKREYDLTFDISVAAMFLFTITEAIKNRTDAEQAAALQQELTVLEDV